MAISIDLIRRLREETELSISECKTALEEAGGDIEKAKALLRERGKAVAENKQQRETGEGLVDSYLHTTGRVGALVDIRCETDFVARSQDFKNLAREIAMQVASMDPTGVEELMEQPYIRDPGRKVRDLVTDLISKLGENIVVKRFSRFEI